LHRRSAIWEEWNVKAKADETEGVLESKRWKGEHQPTESGAVLQHVSPVTGNHAAPPHWHTFKMIHRFAHYLSFFFCCADSHEFRSAHPLTFAGMFILTST
jgi:hypothetical protein